MTEESEAKTCKMCSMEIPATARKCPYCHHWQRWFALQNPQTVVLLIVIPLLTAYFVLMGTIVRSPFRQWEQFREHSQQVKIIESTMEFGEDECGPDVIVVGKIENRSSVDWKDIRFQVDFFNPQGGVFDTGQQEAYT